MRLNFFGCSFTEGGGLDNIEYYNLKNNSSLTHTDDGAWETITYWKENNRYSSIIGNILNVNVRNFAEGCNSNENILNKLYEVLNLEDINKDDIFIVQTSIYTRRHFWYEPMQEFYSINDLNFSGWPYSSRDYMKPLNDLYNLYSMYSHNEEYEIKKVINNIDLYNAYAKEKGLKIFWVPWAELQTDKKNWNEIRKTNDLLVDKNLILFDGLSMGTFTGGEKLLMCDEYKEITDRHKSVEGHKVVAEMISEFLKNKI